MHRSLVDYLHGRVDELEKQVESHAGIFKALEDAYYSKVPDYIAYLEGETNRLQTEILKRDNFIRSLQSRNQVSADQVRQPEYAQPFPGVSNESRFPSSISSLTLGFNRY